MYNTCKPYSAKIEEIIQKTWDTPFCLVTRENGPYPRIHVRTDRPQVDHTDGIGTKGIYHWSNKTYEQAAIDAIAMNVNDLLLMGAVPFKMQNHIVIPEDDHGAILSIVNFLAEYCKKNQIALTGGETSIQNNINGMDISLTVSGIVIKTLFVNRFLPGTTIIGLRSSGIHSNGLTRVTQQIDAGKFCVERDCLTTPTKIYSEPIWKVFDHIQGMCHVTGGGFAKLRTFLQGDAILDMPKDDYPEVFGLLSKDIPCEEMYRTFNCGWGFLIATNDPETVLNKIDGKVIGRVVEGTGRVVVKSAFSDSEVIY